MERAHDLVHRSAGPDPEEGRSLQGGELARDARLGLLLRLAGARLMDVAPRQSLILSSGSFAILVSSPIAASFIGAALLLLVLPLLTRRRIASPEELG